MTAGPPRKRQETGPSSDRASPRATRFVERAVGHPGEPARCEHDAARTKASSRGVPNRQRGGEPAATSDANVMGHLAARIRQLHRGFRLHGPPLGPASTEQHRTPIRASSRPFSRRIWCVVLSDPEPAGGGHQLQLPAGDVAPTSRGGTGALRRYRDLRLARQGARVPTPRSEVRGPSRTGGRDAGV